MRNLLISLASLVALQDASAECIPTYGPTGHPEVFELSSHAILVDDLDHKWTTRSFVHLGDAPTGSPAWIDLAPGTYDPTLIADAPDLATPRELTLIGPSGTQIVSSRDRVFLRPAIGRHHTPTSALEVNPKRGTFRFALGGRHTDVRWIELGVERRGTAADIAWAERQLSSATNVYVSSGTGFDIVSATAANGTTYSFVRSSDVPRRWFRGTVRGAIQFKGRTFVLFAPPNGSIRPVPIDC